MDQNNQNQPYTLESYTSITQKQSESEQNQEEYNEQYFNKHFKDSQHEQHSFPHLEQSQISYDQNYRELMHKMSEYQYEDKTIDKRYHSKHTSEVIYISQKKKTADQIIQYNKTWAAKIKQTEPQFFHELSLAQTPQFLWIGCADSRVPAERLTGLGPGELFVHRNVANQVIHTDLNCLSVVQFAVEVLKVTDIIVCGHYKCGGVNAAILNTKLGLINNWLHHIRDIYLRYREFIDSIENWDEKSNRMSELNILQQVYNLGNSTILQEAWSRGQKVTVHAWIYELKDGHIKQLGVVDQNEVIYKQKAHPQNKLFVKTHWSNSEEDYTKLLQQCAKRMKTSHPNILQMIGYNQNSETQICGDYQKITCYFEYLSLDLDKEIHKRQQQNNFFSEPEIWYILDSVINACAFFESNKIYHGDLRPSNILLTNQGVVKIADHGIVNSIKNGKIKQLLILLQKNNKKGYIKALQNNEQLYLSPFLMNGLRNQELKPAHNVFKSDVYSLGMTILECCNLQSLLSTCYCFDNFCINQNALSQQLNFARQRYSPFLINLIQEMVNFDERQRPNFYEIQSILAPYRVNIQNVSPFTADYQTIKKSYVNPDLSYLAQSGIVYQQQQVIIPVQQQVNSGNNQYGININQSFSQMRPSHASSVHNHGQPILQQSNNKQQYPQQFFSLNNLPPHCIVSPQQENNCFQIPVQYEFQTPTTNINGNSFLYGIQTPLVEENLKNKINPEGQMDESEVQFNVDENMVCQKLTGGNNQQQQVLANNNNNSRNQ